MLNAPVKAVLFDFDMTLVDSSYVITECMNRLAEAKGLRRITREELLSVIGLELEDSWKVLWGRVEPDWLDFYRGNFRELELGGFKEFPGTRRLPEALRRTGIHTGIVSNRRFARMAAERAGLAGLFDVIVGLEDVERGKPAPDSLLFAIERLGIVPADAVYVGDTDLDMIAARAAGIRAVGVSTGNLDESALREAGGDAACADLLEVPAAIGLKLEQFEF